MSGKREELEYIEIGSQIQDGRRKQGSRQLQSHEQVKHRSTPQGSSPANRRSTPQGSSPAGPCSTSQRGGRTNCRQTRYNKRRERRKRRVLRLWSAAVLLLLCLGMIWCYPELSRLPGRLRQLFQREGLSGRAAGIMETEGVYAGEGADQSVMAGSSRTEQEEIAEELQEMLEKNEETRDFVEGYPDREKYRNQPIDLSQDYEDGKVPLLMQWDRRWGYDAYGDSMIGLAGCGPTCLTMAYLYFTGDIQWNPRRMAEFAFDNGYFVSGATSWDLWTTGAEGLGLHGEELPLDENRMKNALDSGGLVVCSMRPGDFTTTGHFILLTGYDENGFYVNDPNRRSTSAKQWDYDTLSWQIKNLWALTD